MFRVQGFRVYCKVQHGLKTRHIVVRAGAVVGVSGVAVVWEDESSGDAPPSCAVKSLASNRLLLPVVVVALAVPPPPPATSTAMAMASLTTSSVISFHHCACYHSRGKEGPEMHFHRTWKERRNG